MPALPGAAETLLVVLRCLHGFAAIVFLGWSAVVWLDGPPRGDALFARRRFKEVIDLSLVVFLASGAILTFDRLSAGASSLYAIVLVVKLACGVVAYQFAFRWRRAGLTLRGGEGRGVLIAGTAAVLLAAVLTEVFERGLRSTS